MQKAIGREASTITALFTFDRYSFELVAHARQMSRDGRFNWRLASFDEKENISTWRGPGDKERTLRASDIKEPESISFTIGRDDSKLEREARRIAQEQNISERDAMTGLMVWLDYAIEALLEDADHYSQRIESDRLLLPEEVFEDEEEEKGLSEPQARAAALLLQGSE